MWVKNRAFMVDIDIYGNELCNEDCDCASMNRECERVRIKDSFQDKKWSLPDNIISPSSADIFCKLFPMLEPNFMALSSRVFETVESWSRKQDFFIKLDQLFIFSPQPNSLDKSAIAKRLEEGRNHLKPSHNIDSPSIF